MDTSIGSTLAQVQNSLKKEKVIETLTEARLKILNQQLCENFDEILSKRKLYMYMIGYYQDLYNIEIYPSFFSSIFNDAKTLHPTKSINSRITLKYIKYFRDNLSTLAKAADILIFTRPDLINILTYSTIPSIFGLLARYSEQKLFLNFIKFLKTEKGIENGRKDTAILFARPLFLIPEFRIYIQSIADQISVQFCNIHGTELAEKFLSEFLEYADKFIHLCPPIIGLLAQESFSDEIFDQSFFQEVIRHPLYFGFVQIGELENISEAASIVLSETASRNNFLIQLKQIFLKTQQNDNNNVYSEVSKNISAYQHIYHFTTYDTNLITVLISITGNGDKTVPDPFPSEYILNILQDSTQYSNLDDVEIYSIEKKDPIAAAENSLRCLLINADPIPMIGTEQSLSRFLQKNLIDQIPSFLRQQQHAHFAILKSCKKQYKKSHIGQVNFEGFVKMLIPNINNHKKETTHSSSEKLQSYSSSLTQMVNAKNKINDFVTEKKFELSYIAIAACFDQNKIEASGKAFASKSGLIEYFSTLLKTWLSFAKKMNFCFEIPKEMLLVFMLKLYKYNSMILLDHELQSWDELYNQYTSDDYDTNQENKKLDNLFKNERERFGQAINLIKRGFQVQSTLLAMKLISASFKSIDKLLNEVIGSYGMDELTSALFYVIYVARPPNFISKTEYFYRVFQSISEFNIDQYRDYISNTLYLHQTAVYFFHNANPNPLQKDTFMLS